MLETELQQVASEIEGRGSAAGATRGEKSVGRVAGKAARKVGANGTVGAIRSHSHRDLVAVVEMRDAARGEEEGFRHQQLRYVAAAFGEKARLVVIAGERDQIFGPLVKRVLCQD